MTDLDEAVLPEETDLLRLVAFARTAARVACEGSLQSALDSLAAERWTPDCRKFPPRHHRQHSRTVPTLAEPGP